MLQGPENDADHNGIYAWHDWTLDPDGQLPVDFVEDIGRRARGFGYAVSSADAAGAVAALYKGRKAGTVTEAEVTYAITEAELGSTREHFDRLREEEQARAVTCNASLVFEIDGERENLYVEDPGGFTSFHAALCIAYADALRTHPGIRFLGVDWGQAGPPQITDPYALHLYGVSSNAARAVLGKAYTDAMEADGNQRLREHTGYKPSEP